MLLIPIPARRQLNDLSDEMASKVSILEYADARETVLKRDGTKVRTSGCNVVAGTWTSSYDGKKITNPADADIDHMVPLANAWRPSYELEAR